MFQKLKNFWKDDEGAAATEFAIVLPWLMILIYGNFYFRELIVVKLDVVKYARYAAFEYAARLPKLGKSVGTITAELQQEWRNENSIYTDSGSRTLATTDEESIFEFSGGLRGTSGPYPEMTTLAVEKVALRLVMFMPWVTHFGFNIGGLPAIVGNFFDGDDWVPDKGEKQLIRGTVAFSYLPNWSALPLLVGQKTADGTDLNGGGNITIGGDQPDDSYGRFAILVNDWKASTENPHDASDLNDRDEGSAHSVKARVLRVWTLSPIFQNTVILALAEVSNALSYIGFGLINPYDVVDIRWTGADFVGTGNEMGGGTARRSNEKARDGRRVERETQRRSESYDG
jgi:hypothetical protein